MSITALDQLLEVGYNYTKFTDNQYKLRAHKCCMIQELKNLFRPK